MYIKFLDLVDRSAYFSLNKDGSSQHLTEKDSGYLITTFGNMSYICSGNILSNTPKVVHMLVGNYCQIWRKNSKSGEHSSKFFCR